jgi:hypothetical protein
MRLVLSLMPRNTKDETEIYQMCLIKSEQASSGEADGYITLLLCMRNYYLINPFTKMLTYHSCTSQERII